MLHYGKLLTITWNDGYTDYEITLEQFFEKIRHGGDFYQTIKVKISYVNEFGDESSNILSHTIRDWEFYSDLFFSRLKGNE